MNISDRIIWGGVIDYFPVLDVLLINMADVIILVGMIALIFENYIYEKKYHIKSK